MSIDWLSDSVVSIFRTVSEDAPQNGPFFDLSGGASQPLLGAITREIERRRLREHLSERLRADLNAKSYLLFDGAFECAQLPNTPTDFKPIPPETAIDCARIAALVAHSVLGYETISYGSENAGALFVNLVAMHGDGALSEKSRLPMRGHTDAASFPFRGQRDAENSRISASPDVVTLVCLKNPTEVPTTLMPLAEILQLMEPADVAALKENGFLIGSQRTFQQGTAATLGSRHMADKAAVMWDSPEGLWVRYSHSHVTVLDEKDTSLLKAKDAFELAASRVSIPVVLKPGSILVVNNRNTLHGRGQVGSEIGGSTRWLLRTYGLDPIAIEADQRDPNRPYQLFP